MSRPLRILIAPDAFKECMTAREAADAIERGVRRAAASAGERVKTYRTPISDGGGGLIDAMLHAQGGSIRYVRATGPLGDKVRAPVRDEDSIFNWKIMAWGAPLAAIYGAARFGLRSSHAVGWGVGCAIGLVAALVASFRWPFSRPRFPVVQASSVVGLHLIAPDLRDPGLVSTEGLGELIAAACHPKLFELIVGLGNTGSCDGGVGMLEAMGVRFFDGHGAPIKRPLGEDMVRIERIVTSGLDRDVKRGRIFCVCDVDNPLFGPQGAARVFAPQKGATPDQVERLDAGLRNLARRVREAGHDLDPDTPGAGAAGGLGYALGAVCGATLMRGAEYVLGIAGVYDYVARADLVLTGAGRLDSTDLRGKAILGVSRAAAKHNVPTIAFVGSIGAGADDCLAPRRDGGLAAYHVITPPGMPLDEALRRGPELLEAATEKVVREWLEKRGR